ERGFAGAPRTRPLSGTRLGQGAMRRAVDGAHVQRLTMVGAADVRAQRDDGGRAACAARPAGNADRRAECRAAATGVGNKGSAPRDGANAGPTGNGTESRALSAGFLHRL